jgi:hypothetical protein
MQVSGENYLSCFQQGRGYCAALKYTKHCIFKNDSTKKNISPESNLQKRREIPNSSPPPQPLCPK